MPKRQHITHETNGAAFELAEHGTGKVVGVGGRITVPIIYDTVGGPHRAPVTHFVERLNMERAVWAIDKTLNKYPLAFSISAARRYAFLRVVVIDHAGARHVLGPNAKVAKNVEPGDALHVTKAGHVQRATAGKVQRTSAHKLVLADLMAATPPSECPKGRKANGAKGMAKVVRTPKPRRGPAKGRKVAPPVVERESVPMLVPVEDVVAEELAHAQARRVRLGTLGHALVASLASKRAEGRRATR